MFLGRLTAKPPTEETFGINCVRRLDSKRHTDVTRAYPKDEYHLYYLYKQNSRKKILGAYKFAISCRMPEIRRVVFY